MRSDASPPDSTTPAEKSWKTVQAEALLAGYRATLIDGDDGRPMLIITRWALTRCFSELAEAQAWLLRARGAAA